MKNWLKKFQKVEANIYGVLPIMYHPALVNFIKDNGYYTYGLYCDHDYNDDAYKYS